MCATCFDLSVSLLRVLEMTVTLVPEIFLDWSRPSAELLLRRLAQVGSVGPGNVNTANHSAVYTKRETKGEGKWGDSCTNSYLFWTCHC